MMRLALGLCLIAIADTFVDAQPCLWIDTDPSGYTFRVGDEVVFRVSDGCDDQETAFFWDFGDGDVLEGESISRTLTETGVFMVGVWGRKPDGSASEPAFIVVPVNDTVSWTPVSAAIELPLEDHLVMAAGAEIRFQAVESPEIAEYLWHVFPTDRVVQGPLFTWDIPGEWNDFQSEVRLWTVASDGSISSGAATRQFYVFQGNHPPNGFLVSPELQDLDGWQVLRVEAGTHVTLTAGGEDPDGHLPLSFYWETEFGDTATGNSLELHPLEPGEFWVSLTAVDALGQPDPFSFDFSIWVLGENRPPQGWINTCSQTLRIEQPLTLSAGAYDEDSDAVTLVWDLGDGRRIQGEEVEVSYSDVGVYVVRLTAFDDRGGKDPTPFHRYIFVNEAYAVGNQAPFAFIHTPEPGWTFPVGSPLTVEAVGHDEDGDALTVYLDLGDGTLASSENPMLLEKTYDQAGLADLEAFARDEHGLTSWYSDWVPIGIFEGTTPPNGVILEPSPVPDEYGWRVLQIAPGDTVRWLGTVDGQQDLTGYEAIWTLTDPRGEDQYFFGFEPDPLQLDTPGWYVLGFTVRDPEGVEDPIPDVLEIWVRDHNTSPHIWIEEPGWDMPLHLEERFSLAGCGWDEENDAIQFSWELSDGRRFTGDRIDGLRFETPGLHWIQLSATDSAGASATLASRRYLSVFGDFDWDQTWPPQPVRLIPEEREVLAPKGSRLQFAVSNTDADGRELTGFQWDFEKFGTTNTAVADGIVFSDSGSFEVRVFVQGPGGLWSFYPEFWQVTVYGDNIPPQGEITDPPLRTEAVDDFQARLKDVAMGEALTLTGKAWDPDSSRDPQLIWGVNGEEAGSGTTLQLPGFDQPGLLDVILQVRDSRGAMDPFPDTRFIIVVDETLTPESYIMAPEGELTVEPYQELWFYGFGEDPNMLPLTYTWQFGDHAIPSQATGEEVFPVVFTEQSPEDQPYTVTFQARTSRTVDPTPASVKIHVRRYQDDDFEPNNSLNYASPIQPGTYSNLSLDGSDTADVFSFSLEEDHKDLRLGFTTTAGEAPLSVSLFRQEGDAFVEVDIARLEMGQDSLILQDLKAGTYALSIQLTDATKWKQDGLDYGLSVATMAPSLFLPFLVEDGSLISSFSMINPTDETADVSVIGLDAKGTNVATKTFSLKPHERKYVRSLSFFGAVNEVEQARFIRWVKVLATVRLVGHSHAVTRDASQAMASGALRTLASSVFVPHVAQRVDQWYTRAVLINGTESSGNLDMFTPTGLSNMGMLGSESQTDFRFLDLFPDGMPEWGRFSSSDGRAALAGVELFGRKDGFNQVAAIEMIEPRRNNPNFLYIQNNIYFTHVAADTANFWTGIALVNESQQTANYSMTAYGDDGQAMATRTGQLQAGGKLLYVVSDLFPETPGISWIKVEADHGLHGFELFGDHHGQRLAGFSAAAFATDTLFFPHVATGPDNWTGIALLNLSDHPAALDVRGYNDAGVVLLQTDVQLGAREKWVRTVENLFPGRDIPASLGYLEVQAETNCLNGFQLFGDLNQGALGNTMSGLSAQTR